MQKVPDACHKFAVFTENDGSELSQKPLQSPKPQGHVQHWQMSFMTLSPVRRLAWQHFFLIKPCREFHLLKLALSMWFGWNRYNLISASFCRWPNIYWLYPLDGGPDVWCTHDCGEHRMPIQFTSDRIALWVNNRMFQVNGRHNLFDRSPSLYISEAQIVAWKSAVEVRWKC